MTPPVRPDYACDRHGVRLTASHATALALVTLVVLVVVSLLP